MRYVPDHRGVARMLVSDDMGDAVEAAARAGEAFAKSIAPIGRRASDNDDERYVASFEISRGTETGRGGARVTAYLTNTAGHAAAVEWGTGNRAGNHVLSRTVDHLEGGG